MTRPEPLTDVIRSATEQASRAVQHAEELAANAEALETRGEADEADLTKARKAAEQGLQDADTAAAAITAAAVAALTPDHEDLKAVQAGRAAVEALHRDDDPVAAWSAHIGPRLWVASDKPPPEPPAVIWRHQDSDDPDQPPPPGRMLLAAQTVGVLSGEGGCGKSSLTQQIALAAASQTPTDAGLGDIGLAVAPGPVLLWQLEDRRELVHHRLRATADQWSIGTEALSQVAFAAADDATELWRSADHDQARPGPTQDFAALAAAIAIRQPRLVIIDPASCAVLCAQSDLSNVRAFVAAVARLVGPNSGVLIVAHPTKEARANANGGPGVVAGTAAWYDAARLVVTATRPRDSRGRIKEAHRDHVILDAVKANLGIRGPIGPGPLAVVTYGRWPAGLTPAVFPAAVPNGNPPSAAPLDPVGLPYD